LSVDISLVAYFEKADPIASVRQAASRQFVLSAQAWLKITAWRNQNRPGAGHNRRAGA
jgi:hypothetical protein